MRTFSKSVPIATMVINFFIKPHALSVVVTPCGEPGSRFPETALFTDEELIAVEGGDILVFLFGEGLAWPFGRGHRPLVVPIPQPS